MAKKSNYSGATKAAQESGVLRKTGSDTASAAQEATAIIKAETNQRSHTASMAEKSESNTPSQDKKDVPKWFKLGQR